MGQLPVFRSSEFPPSILTWFLQRPRFSELLQEFLNFWMRSRRFRSAQAAPFQPNQINDAFSAESPTSTTLVCTP